MSDESEKKRRDCGTMQVHRRLIDGDPHYARRLEKIEEHAFRVTQGMHTLRPGCTKIPVVVHVIYKTAGQNISMAQINSQIAILNQDFRKKNTDVSTVPAAFAPLVGDARIEFELATSDPDGNATDGVTRTETRANSFDTTDKMKFSASGGHDAWLADEYLNIWVCQMSGGILGYAQFPGGAAATDGVVITHTGFGDTGTAAAPFDQGRTATHEVGHWLNLRHIWGDDGSGCSGSDYVADTPNQGGANIGKPTFPNVSCSNGPNGDMFMNYMDYVDDDTMVMFSEGQIARMHACLDGPRSAIGVSIPCITAGPKIPFKDGLKDFPKDSPKDFGKDTPKDFPKDFGKDFQKDPPKDFGKDGPKDGPKDPPKDFGKDGPKDMPKDLIKDQPKEFFKEYPFDPGPKNIIGDLPPKTIFEPPKSFMEPPIDFPVQPTLPVQPALPMQPVMPFVLSTGAAPGGVGASPPPQGTAVAPQVMGAYGQLLQQYAGLYQRGMLDEQGLAAWQQAYVAYRQMGGQ